MQRKMIMMIHYFFAIVLSFPGVFAQTMSVSAGDAIRVHTLAPSPFTTHSTKDGHLSGLIIDLLDAMSPLASFTYTINLVPDGAYGAIQPDGKWNGLVGSLIENTTDLAATDLTITSDRELVIDFLTPFLLAQIRILVNPKFGTENVKYLVVKDTSFESLLRTSKVQKYKAMWTNIQEHNGYVLSTADGVEKVLAGGYAMVSDTTQFSAFLREHDGQLQYSREVILSSFLTFGVQQGSPLRDKLSYALEKLNEIGKLQQLLEKYDL